VPALPGSTPPSVAPGTPPGSYALSDLETIELYSGKVNFVVPIRDIQGRGSAGYRMKVAVQRGWSIEEIPVPGQNPEPFPISMETPDMIYANLPAEPDMAIEPFQPGYMIARSVAAPGFTCPNDSPRYYGGYTLTKVVFLEPDGTETEFVDQQYGGAPQPTPNCNATPTGQGYSRGTLFVAVDGSAKTFMASATVYDDTYVQPRESQISGTLFFPDGTQYQFLDGVTGIHDPKGNDTQILLNSPPCGQSNPCQPNVESFFWVEDPDGRSTSVTLANLADSVVQDSILYSGADGAARWSHVVYSQMQSVPISGQTEQDLRCLFPSLTSTEGTGNLFNPWVISAIVLPNSQQYSFLYNMYGEVAQITLPSGGVIQYDYVLPSTSCPTTDAPAPSGSGQPTVSGLIGFTTVQRRLQQRRVYPNGSTLEQKTTYQWPIMSGTANGGAGETEVTVTHIDPSTGNAISQENHYFYGDPDSENTDPVIYTFWQESKEYETDLLDGNGNILRKIVNAWQQPSCTQYPSHAACWFVNDTSYPPYTTIGCPFGCSDSYQAPVYYPSILSTTTTLSDSGQMSGVTYSYDQYNNPVSTTEYDYGTPNSGNWGAELRNTQTTYLTNGYDTVNGNSAASTIHIRRAPTDRKVYNGSGVYVAETQYSYDIPATTPASGTPTGYVTPTAARSCSPVPTGLCLGNVTTSQQWSSTLVQFLPTTRTYDNLGNVLSVTDPNLNKTTYIYTDSFSTVQTLPSGESTSAFPTTVTNALNQTSTYEYDYYLGRPTSATDPNSITTGFAYVDPLDRLTQVTRGSDTAQTTYAYVDTPNNVSVTTTSDQASLNDNIIKSEVFYDGLARKEVTWQYADCGYILVQQTYDAMGRPYQVSNPYRPCNYEPLENTTTLYDALNRPLTVTTADGSPTSMSYLGNKTTITDPAGKTRSTLTDAAGRITSVTEAGTLLTSYLYDALNDLTNVCQGATFSGAVCSSGGQPRTFAYDSLARLTSAMNPESVSATAYVYDKDGNLTTKTDANGNTVTTAYDQLNRVISKTYSVQAPTVPTPSVTYCYDGNTLSPCTGAPSGAYNLVGHLTLVGSTASTTTYGQYDKLGDIAQSSQTTGGNTYTFGYGYNLANAMTGMTLPSGRAVSWTYDIANRTTSAGWTPPGGSTEPYASAVQYASQGDISQFTLGNGLVEARSYDQWRQQPIGVTLGTSATDSSRLGLSFSYCVSGSPCTNNNGNLQSQAIGPLGATQTYTYDNLNRLYTSAEASGSAATWSETFNYDNFGNRWVPAYSGITLSGLTPMGNSYNPATNRFLSSDTNFLYDSNGNQTKVSPYAITYDAENRQTNVAIDGGTTATYAYDGDGRRVTKTIIGGSTTVYVYDAKGDLEAEYSTAPPTETDTLYLTTDHLGSTRVVSNATGAVVGYHDYLPFGEEIPSGTGGRGSLYDAADGVTHKYTSKERDTETGLDFFGARYFSGAQGRFTSPDPSGLGAAVTNPQSWNKYAYVRSNPYKLVDKNGLYPTSVHHEIDKLAFPSLSSDDLAIVMQGSDYQDRWAGQAPDQAYTHGQEDGFTYGMHEKERGDELVDRLLKEAANLQKQWHDAGNAGYNPGSLFRVGQAAHLLQDRTSWFHQNLPRWYGGVAPTDWIHGAFENLYNFHWFLAGDVQQAVEVTAPLISVLNTPVVTSTITFGPIEDVTPTITFDVKPSDPKEPPQ